MNRLVAFTQFLRDRRWHPAIALAVILFFPLLVEHGYSEFVRGSELNSRMGWFLLLLATVWVIRKAFVLPVIGTIFIISGSLDVLYASTFGGVFTSASFEAMALTDSSEAVDFLKAYAGVENLSLLIIYLVLSIYFVGRQKIITSDDRWYKTVVTLGSLMLMVLVYRVGYMGWIYSTFPGFMGSVKGYVNGSKTIARLIEARATLVNNSPIKVVQGQSDQPQTYVILIGESLSRNHMSLYGYQRKTTPGLDSKMNELLVFDNVISSHTQTQPSLRRALTQKNTKNKISVYDALSIVDIANMAGYKTWWISNQHPLRSTISSIAGMADKTHFISNDFHGVMDHRFDGYMLPSIEEAIADKAPMKAIFVHMMGSHLQYDNRYPEDFSIFNDNNVNAFTKNPSERQINYINSYDNSVRYTDSIVTKVIGMLENNSQASMSGLLFFSDHGEEVYDTIDFIGHRPDSITSSMVEIPFIAWTSKAYNQNRNSLVSILKKNTSKPFMLDNAFLAMTTFMGIHSEKFGHYANLFSDQGKTPTRIVYSKNYDTDLNPPARTVSKRVNTLQSPVNVNKELTLLK